MDFIYIIKFICYNRKIKKNNQKSYILFGVPKHGNIGDHAITISFYEILKKYKNVDVFEVPISITDFFIKCFARDINKSACILINGGGFMGSQWMTEENMIRAIISGFPNNKIIILPQTIYYTKDNKGIEELKKSLSICDKHKQLIICTREKFSYDFAIQNYKNAKILLVPDLVLYLERNKQFNTLRRSGILFCLRKDVEKSLSNEDEQKIINLVNKYCENIDFNDTVIKKAIYKKDRKKILENKLDEFSKYKLIITDRLHGMIFAAITGSPCIVLGNYNYKIKGVYEWIKTLDYIQYIENLDDIEKYFEKLMNVNETKYSNNIVIDYYNELINIL